MGVECVDVRKLPPAPASGEAAGVAEVDVEVEEEEEEEVEVEVEVEVAVEEEAVGVDVDVDVDADADADMDAGGDDVEEASGLLPDGVAEEFEVAEGAEAAEEVTFDASGPSGVEDADRLLGVVAVAAAAGADVGGDLGKWMS